MSHHLQHRHGKCMLSMLGDGMYDIAFRYEATYHVATFYDQGGDTVCPHQGGGSSDRRSRVDCEDLRALAIQNILNAHEHPPVSCRNCIQRPRLADTRIISKRCAHIESPRPTCQTSSLCSVSSRGRGGVELSSYLHAFILHDLAGGSLKARAPTSMDGVDT